MIYSYTVLHAASSRYVNTLLPGTAASIRRRAAGETGPSHELYSIVSRCKCARTPVVYLQVQQYNAVHQESWISTVCVLLLAQRFSLAN